MLARPLTGLLPFLYKFFPQATLGLNLPARVWHLFLLWTPPRPGFRCSMLHAVSIMQLLVAESVTVFGGIFR